MASLTLASYQEALGMVGLALINFRHQLAVLGINILRAIINVYADTSRVQNIVKIQPVPPKFEKENHFAAVSILRI